MLKRRILPVVLCSLVYIQPAYAQGIVEIWDGRKLYELCSSAKPSASLLASWQAGQCHGYVLAIADMLNGTRICVPSEVGAGHLREIVVNHIATRPDKYRDSAAILVTDALVAEFPCR